MQRLLLPVLQRLRLWVGILNRVGGRTVSCEDFNILAESCDQVVVVWPSSTQLECTEDGGGGGWNHDRFESSLVDRG